MKQRPLRLFCVLILVSTLSNLLPKKKKKNVPRGLFEHSVSSVFFSFFVFILACFSCWWWFPVIDGIIYSV